MFGDENIIELKVDDSKIKRAGWHLPSSIFYIKVIQEVMGHADVSTTMNIYAEANPDVTKSVIEKLSKNMDIF